MSRGCTTGKNLEILRLGAYIGWLAQLLLRLSLAQEEGGREDKKGGKEEGGREDLLFAVQNQQSVTLNYNRMPLEEISKGSPDLLH